MKFRPIWCALLLCLSLFFSGTTVLAASELKVSLAAPEGIKVKEAFDVYAEFYCSRGIGAARAVITYDAEHLSFKKATLEEKGEYDFFSYSEQEGEVHFSLTNSIDELERQVVVLHFSPLDDTPARYPFQITFCEACDPQAQPLSVSGLPSCRVTAAARVVPDRKTSHQASSAVSSAASSASRPPAASSKSLSDYQSSRKQASGVAGRFPEESLSEAEERTSADDRVYYIHDQDTSFRLDKNFFLLLAGVLAVLVTLIILLYRFLMKRKEKRIRDSLFQEAPPITDASSRETPEQSRPRETPSASSAPPEKEAPSPSGPSPEDGIHKD